MVKIPETLSIRKIDKEIFIYDRKMSNIHSLNRVASFIWELLVDDVDFNIITDKICSQFEIDRETAEKDKKAFIKELKDKKLIQLII